MGMRSRGNWLPGIFAGALAVLLSAAPATAVVRYVENFGVDSGSCGAAFATPCRTISQGIINASAGDIIFIGPGVYGDFDGDGTFSFPGYDEPAEIGYGCNCVVKVDKQVTLMARRGLGTAVIQYKVANSASIVNVLANGAALMSLSVVGPRTFGTGIIISSGVSRVRFIHNEVEAGGEYGFVLDSANSNLLSGNQATAHNSIDYFLHEGSSNTLVNNFSHNSGSGFHLWGGTGHRLISNRTFNIGTPFAIPIGFIIDNGFDPGAAYGHLLSRNVAACTHQDGFEGGGFHHYAAAGPISMIGNLAVANEVMGFNIEVANSAMIGNSAIGNANCGMVAAGGNTIRLGNVFGNGFMPDAPVEGFIYPSFNCGLHVLTSTGTVTATDNFWGASTGPGLDPADEVSVMGGPATTTPFATVPYR